MVYQDLCAKRNHWTMRKFFRRVARERKNQTVRQTKNNKNKHENCCCCLVLRRFFSDSENKRVDRFIHAPIAQYCTSGHRRTTKNRVLDWRRRRRIDKNRAPDWRRSRRILKKWSTGLTTKTKNRVPGLTTKTENRVPDRRRTRRRIEYGICSFDDENATAVSKIVRNDYYDDDYYCTILLLQIAALGLAIALAAAAVATAL